MKTYLFWFLANLFLGSLGWLCNSSVFETIDYNDISSSFYNIDVHPESTPPASMACWNRVFKQYENSISTPSTLRIEFFWRPIIKQWTLLEMRTLAEHADLIFEIFFFILISIFHTHITYWQCLHSCHWEFNCVRAPLHRCVNSWRIPSNPRRHSACKPSKIMINEFFNTLQKSLGNKTMFFSS